MICENIDILKAEMGSAFSMKIKEIQKMIFNLKKSMEGKVSEPGPGEYGMWNNPTNY